MEKVKAQKNWREAVRRNASRGAWGGSIIAFLFMVISFKGPSFTFYDVILAFSAMVTVICAPIHIIMSFKIERWYALVPLSVILLVLAVNKTLAWVVFWSLATIFLSPYFLLIGAK